jgi:hypothetical protein
MNALDRFQEPAPVKPIATEPFEVVVPVGDNTIVAEVQIDYDEVKILHTWLVHPDCPDVRMPFETDCLQVRKFGKFTSEDVDTVIEIAAWEQYND